MSTNYCVAEQKGCVVWVDKYFKDCLCNVGDKLSFGFGMVSLVCWGVAEIPQIITNFHSKSSHGVSILFLLTWVIGDIFNLVGCLLEPATLPTQYYTAVLYTTTTIVLVLQSLYYDYLYKYCSKKKTHDSPSEVEDVKNPLIPSPAADSGIPIPKGNIKESRHTDFYFTSARSLAGSATPPMRSNLWSVRSGPSAYAVMSENDADYASEDDTVHRPASEKSTSQPKPIPRSAGYGAFLATSLSLPQQGKAVMQVYVGIAGRKLLQDHGSENYILGQWLGWMMAAIYMGGRLPQIWLNIKRGSVEGLNPLMFVFALVANVAYVGSILARTTEWDKLQANLPWLLDAAVCVVLDLFIILQYIYYRYFRNKTSRSSEDTGGYV